MNMLRKYTKKVVVVNEASSPEGRAERLRRVRNMANLSRERMCTGQGLNINTYKGWEIARYGGLPVDGAEKVIARVTAEGVVCTSEWLLHGVGVGPYIVPDCSKATNDAAEPGASWGYEQQSLLNEIQLFKRHFPNAVVYEIEDDGLSPLYKVGDIAAGVPHYQAQIQNLIGENCIVQTDTGAVLARQVRESQTKGKFTLICTNMQTTLLKPILYDMTLISAARIIRHYRRSNIE